MSSVDAHRRLMSPTRLDDERIFEFPRARVFRCSSFPIAALCPAPPPAPQNHSTERSRRPPCHGTSWPTPPSRTFSRPLTIPAPRRLCDCTTSMSAAAAHLRHENGPTVGATVGGALVEIIIIVIIEIRRRPTRGSSGRPCKPLMS